MIRREGVKHVSQLGRRCGVRRTFCRSFSIIDSPRQESPESLTLQHTQDGLCLFAQTSQVYVQGETAYVMRGAAKSSALEFRFLRILTVLMLAAGSAHGPRISERNAHTPL